MHGNKFKALVIESTKQNNITFIEFNATMSDYCLLATRLIPKNSLFIAVANAANYS